MRIQDYIRQRNEKHRAELKAMESKIAENADKAEALNIILGEENDDETNLSSGGDTDGGSGN